MILQISERAAKLLLSMLIITISMHLAFINSKRYTINYYEKPTKISIKVENMTTEEYMQLLSTVTPYRELMGDLINSTKSVYIWDIPEYFENLFWLFYSGILIIIVYKLKRIS